MPKDTVVRKSRASRKASSTKERHARICRAITAKKEIPFRCDRCKKKDLRYFVETQTRRCARCISAQCPYNLFVPKEEWEKVEDAERKKEIKLLRLKEATARAERKLAEAKQKKLLFACRDRKLLVAQEQMQEAESSSTGPLEPLESSTAEGWS